MQWYYRPIGQVVVATAVGLAFTREALTELMSHGGYMVAGAFLTIAAGYIAALLLVRLAHTDGTTAFFASMPGGPVEMATMAEKFGVPGGPVALAQTMRIAGIVLFIAPVLLWSQGALRPNLLRFDGDVHVKGLLLLYGDRHHRRRCLQEAAALERVLSGPGRGNGGIDVQRYYAFGDSVSAAGGGPDPSRCLTGLAFRP